MILREIRELQPYISTYYETTKYVMEKEKIPIVGGQNTTSLPEDTATATNSRMVLNALKDYISTAATFKVRYRTMVMLF